MTSDDSPRSAPAPAPVSRHSICRVEELFSGWVDVRRVHYAQTMRSGAVIHQDREISSRGDGVTTLLYNPARGTILLLRQPRIISTLRGDAVGETIEACSGLVGGSTPEDAARKEVLEETGYTVENLTFVSSVYESPGGSSDFVHLFLGEYGDGQPNGSAGLEEEGEDIELLEVPLAQALEMFRAGTLRDGRTMLLVQHLALSLAARRDKPGR